VVFFHIKSLPTWTFFDDLKKMKMRYFRGNYSALMENCALLRVHSSGLSDSKYIGTFYFLYL
jgi:hypothetical protein